MTKYFLRVISLTVLALVTISTFNNVNADCPNRSQMECANMISSSYKGAVDFCFDLNRKENKICNKKLDVWHSWWIKYCQKQCDEKKRVH
jgi:hypothetical protein